VYEETIRRTPLPVTEEPPVLTSADMYSLFNEEQTYAARARRMLADRVATESQTTREGSSNDYE
jgi:hypothetical protein